MKKNNKGFTLIEMLGAVVLLGILSTVAVVSVSRYLTKSRKNAFQIMEQSIYEAVKSCQIQNNCVAGNIYDTEFLINSGYLNSLKNPHSSQKDCSGSVTIKQVNEASDSEYQKYQYIVSLTCPGLYNGTAQTSTWPKKYEDSSDNPIVIESNRNSSYIIPQGTSFFNVQIYEKSDNQISKNNTILMEAFIGDKSIEKCNGELIQYGDIKTLNNNGIEIPYRIRPTSLDNKFSCSGKVKLHFPAGFAADSIGVKSADTTITVGTISNSNGY